MPDERYKPLKRFIARAGGVRLGMHQTLRDQIVELSVAEFPFDAPDDRKAEVLAARVRKRARERYDSIVAMILIGVLVNLITKIIVEWWKRNHTNQALMRGWHAEATADVPPPAGGPEAGG